jgi:aminopeptidase N
LNYRPNNLLKTEFHVSVTMSSYLVAIVISDFECVSKIVPNTGEYDQVTVSICGRSHAVSTGQLDYTLEVASKLIKFFEDYYDLKYPIEKIGDF